MSKIHQGKIGEEKVSKKLEKIKGYHRLMNDVTFINEKSEISHQIDHIFICEHGVFVIETKNYYGEIIASNDGYWIQKYK